MVVFAVAQGVVEVVMIRTNDIDSIVNHDIELLLILNNKVEY